MALTNKNLFNERQINGGDQKIYRLGDWGLSLINSSGAHSYTFAWEAAVLRWTKDGRGMESSAIDYSTSLTNDVEVFGNDEEANRFILKAFKVFEKLQAQNRLTKKAKKPKSTLKAHPKGKKRKRRTQVYKGGR